MEELEVEKQEHQIAAPSMKSHRDGWAETFRMMSAHRDDRLLDKDALAQTQWDENEWQW